MPAAIGPKSDCFAAIRLMVSGFVAAHHGAAVIVVMFNTVDLESGL
jgi:hypothetical protein